MIAAKQKGRVVCSYINPKALELTEKNAKENELEIEVKESDLFSELNGIKETERKLEKKD